MAAVVRLLTVPSGVSVRVEISLCERPSKYARTSNSRWAGVSRESAAAMSKPREIACRVRLPRLRQGVPVDRSDAGFAAPDQVRRPVAGYAIHPGPEAGPRGIEAPRVSPDGREHVLHQVFGEPPVPEVAGPGPVDQPRVTVVEGAERPPVPRGHPTHQDLVLHLGHPEPSVRRRDCTPRPPHREGMIARSRLGHRGRGA